MIIVGNAISEKILLNKKNDVYYVNSLTKVMNLEFIKNYEKIVIIEPYFGNILERKIRNKNFLKNKILTISYNDTIIHKYGNKKNQDSYLKFDEKSILKKIDEFK